LTENDASTDNYPRDMISIVCPCCGELVPVELILNAGDLSRYMELIGINEGGYSEKDSRKHWPVVALEIKADERRLVDDKLTSLLKRYDEAKVKLMPEL